MHKIIYLIAIISVLSSCKTKLIVTDFKAENIANYQNISTTDSSLLAFVNPYSTEINREMQTVIAISDVELVKKKPESLLTNYMADILLYEGQIYASKHQAHPIPELAYLNYGGLRTDLPRGKITVGKIFELMPFENEMVLLRLKGDDLNAMARMIAAKGGDSVAGITLTIKDGKPGLFLINNKPVQNNKEYWIVTNDYVANGGDNMTMFGNRTMFINTGIKLRDCFINHLQRDYDAGKIISPKLDGRISHE
ncbi:5'-nucleotidase C-terminal domain-containing protein [Mangrovibacterium marinum]|nr:5'-nucleotidase [Mangrovibacterium marinum]